MRNLLVVFLAAVISACAGSAGTAADEFNQLAAKTESEIRIAEKTGFLWRDTEKLLREARHAQSEGRHDEAMTLANQALGQARMAEQQARDGAHAGPVFPNP